MKKIFRFAIVLALAGTALLTGCTKDYGTEIADLTKQVNELTTKFDKIQAAFDNGAVLQDVKATSDGVAVTVSKNGTTTTYNITNGKDGKDGEDGKNGSNGTNGENGKNGKDGKDGSVVTIGADGYWYIDGVKTEYKATGDKGEKGDPGEPGAPGAPGEPGAPGKDGLSWTFGKNADGKVGFTSSEGTFVPLFEDGSAPVIAKVTNGKLTLYNVEGVANGEYTFDTIAPLKSLAFVPETIFDGLGVITIWQLNYGGATLNRAYPYVKPVVPTTAASNLFLTAVPTTVSYRFNPDNVDPSLYSYSFINRDVKTITKADADKSDLLEIKAGPTKKNGFYDFDIVLKKQLDPQTFNFVRSANDKNNNIVALRAAENAGDEVIVSDYQYIESSVNTGYEIIHKKEYVKGQPKPFRTESDKVKIDDPCDCDIPGITNHYGTVNPLYVSLNYKEEIDLLDYVETYATEIGDILTKNGINPTYEFWFATSTGTDASVKIGKIGKDVEYNSTTGETTNQNKFVVLNGSKLKVDNEFVQSGSPAIGRTPLIYVRSSVEGKPVAEAFIKIRIVENDPSPAKGWNVFIIHNAQFKDLTATPTFTGYAGKAEAPLKPAEDPSDHTLNVDWNEINQWVLDVLPMSYADFGAKYKLDEPKIILKKNATTGAGEAITGDKDVINCGPTDPAYLSRENAVIDAFGNIPAYYTGAAGDKLSPNNWEQSTNIANVKVSNAAPADGKTYRVYVLYEAKDNEKNVDVVLEFVYSIDKHSHDYTIFNWVLSPNYVLNDEPNKPWLLNADRPSNINAAADRTKYGVVQVKGQANNNISGVIEHFKEYGKNGFVTVKDDAEYTFEVVNYVEGDVFYTVTNAGTVGSTTISGKKYSNVTLTAQELKDVIAQTKDTPYIKLADDAQLSDAKEILVKVTEKCLTNNESKDAYYYVVFVSSQPEIRLKTNLALGDYRLYSDYYLLHEIIDGVYGDGNKIIEWDETAGAWKAIEENSAAYGITNANVANVVFKVKNLTYTYGNNVDEFGNRLYKVNAGDAPALGYDAGVTFAEDGIEWLNLATDLQYDLKFGIVVEGSFTPAGSTTASAFKDGEGECKVLSTAHTTAQKNPNHKTDGTLNNPIWKE